jgi:predicted dehydrogenase
MAATRTLGVGIVGIGWVATQHLAAFLKNPHARVVYLCDQAEAPMRERLAKAGVSCPDAKFTTSYKDLLKSRDVDVVSIATPNHLHADQAVAAAKAGKHILVEKPMGLTLRELARIRDAVRKAKVRTITSFELHYNPYVRFAKWLREAGWLGELRFARFQYLSRVTDWYSGWSWVRTKKMGGSHLLAAGCHAVDALRWCTGLEAAEVSAYHTRFTEGYEWPTSIVANLKLRPTQPRRGGASRGARRREPVLGQIVSSTDFQMPYAFEVEMMGDRATIRNDWILWNDVPFDLDAMKRACPFPDVSFREDQTPTGAKAIRLVSEMPGSADVSHHPFQGEIDELIDCILEGRETHLSVFDGQKTMELCIAADMSAEKNGRPVRLPLLKS